MRGRSASRSFTRSPSSRSTDGQYRYRTPRARDPRALRRAAGRRAAPGRGRGPGAAAGGARGRPRRGDRDRDARRPAVARVRAAADACPLHRGRHADAVSLMTPILIVGLLVVVAVVLLAIVLNGQPGEDEDAVATHRSIFDDEGRRR